MTKGEGRMNEPETKVAESGKRPYVKPEFSYERAFETSALTCGKTIALTCSVPTRSAS